MDKQKTETVDTTVAATILQQLGGKEFLLMTGSEVAEMKIFRIGIDLQPNKSRANKLTVAYNVSKDLYNMSFIKEERKSADGPYGFVKVAVFQEVYFDQLQDLFEEVTGLYTTLFPRQK